MPDFSEAEWRQIEEKLDGDRAGYGMPIRNSKSVVLTSWNIRKFGSLNDS